MTTEKAIVSKAFKLNKSDALLLLLVCHNFSLGQRSDSAAGFGAEVTGDRLSNLEAQLQHYVDVYDNDIPLNPNEDRNERGTKTRRRFRRSP